MFMCCPCLFFGSTLIFFVFCFWFLSPFYPTPHRSFPHRSISPPGFGSVRQPSHHPHPRTPHARRPNPTLRKTFSTPVTTRPHHNGNGNTNTPHHLHTQYSAPHFRLAGGAGGGGGGGGGTNEVRRHTTGNNSPS